MIIKNLWIISPIGLCYFHYIAPFSDYTMDENLFSGLISGLSKFTESLMAENKSIEFVKLDEDELYIESLGEIIVAAILSPREEKIQSFSVKTMLQFIGTKFLDLYLSNTEDFTFDWDQISKQFENEIKNYFQDKDLLEDIKREQFQNLFNEAISGNLPIDLLHWRGIQLFSNTSPEVLKDSLKIISSLVEVSSTLINDVLLESKITEVLHRLTRDLKSNILEQEPKKLLILCRSDETFLELYKIFLPQKILSIHCPSFDYLQEVIETWNDPNPFDILVIDTQVSTKEIRTLHSMDMNDKTRILMVINKIPRPPRGRLIQKKTISFIVQENIDEIDQNSPLVDYLKTYLVQDS